MDLDFLDTRSRNDKNISPDDVLTWVKESLPSRNSVQDFFHQIMISPLRRRLFAADFW